MGCKDQAVGSQERVRDNGLPYAGNPNAVSGNNENAVRSGQVYHLAEPYGQELKWGDEVVGDVRVYSTARSRGQVTG